MPAYFRDLICNFITRPNSEIFHELASRNAEARFSLTPEAIHAWEDQLPFLKAAFSQLVSVVPDSENWTLLLEYPVPQLGQRLDLVVLAHQAILAIEIKTGVSPTAARRQVEDYAISLACFHGQTHPVVVNVSGKGDHYTGKATVKQTEFGMKPVTVGGGTVKVKDEVEIEFAIVTQ